MALINPGMRGLICRKARASLSSTGLVTWRKAVANEALLTGDVEYYGGNVDEPGYQYRNGSVVVIGGLDKASKIMSSEYDVIYVQECTELTEDDWEALLSRLRNGVVSFQQLMGDCNPSTPTHWLRRRCDEGSAVMYNTRHEENPLYFTADGKITGRGADYIAKLDALTGVRYARLRKGLWVAAEGIIYEDFDPAVHIADAMPAGWERWQRYWSVDFGFVNPFVCQFWAESPDGELWLYREIYRTRKTVEQHAEAIKRVVCPDGKWIEPKPARIVCDHDAEGRAVLEKHFGSTKAAHKAVTEGIQAAQNRFHARVNGSPRIRILRNCRINRDPDLADAHKPTCTEEEISGYVWADGAKEAPLKADDHGCDAMRYLVAEADLQPKPSFRWMNA